MKDAAKCLRNAIIAQHDDEIMFNRPAGGWRVVWETCKEAPIGVSTSSVGAVLSSDNARSCEVCGNSKK